MAYTEFYCDASTGNNFASGTDAGATRFLYVNGTWVSATGVFTTLIENPLADGVVVGDFASIFISGAGFMTGFVARITGVTATTITVSLTAKAGTPPTDGSPRACRIGGCWKGPNGSVAFPFGFMVQALNDGTNTTPRVNFKRGTTFYTTATATHTIADSGPVIWQGYSTTPGDGGRAMWGSIIGSGSHILLNLGSSACRRQWLEDFEFYANGPTGTANGVTFGSTDGGARNVTIQQSRGIGFNVTSVGGTFIQCEAYSCNFAGTAGVAGFTHGTNVRLIRCSAIANQGDGFSTVANPSQNSTLINCMSYSNLGHGYAFKCPTATAGSSLVMRHCDAHTNGGDGLSINAVTAGGSIFLENCNFIKNTGWGIRQLDSPLYHMLIMRNCAFGAGTYANALGNLSFSATANCLIEDGTINYPANTLPWNSTTLFMGSGPGIGAAYEEFASSSLGLVDLDTHNSDLSCTQGPGVGAHFTRRLRR